MSEEKRGYEIHERFYPYVPVDQWFNQDFVLAREITRMSIGDLFAGKGDNLAVNLALAAIAVWHGQPDLEMERLIKFMYKLKPADIVEVGFDELPQPEADADPPAGNAGDSPTPASDSSETSKPSTASSPASTEPQPTSGDPGSATGSPATDAAT